MDSWRLHWKLFVSIPTRLHNTTNICKAPRVRLQKNSSTQPNTPCAIQDSESEDDDGEPRRGKSNHKILVTVQGPDDEARTHLKLGSRSSCIPSTPEEFPAIIREASCDEIHAVDTPSCQTPPAQATFVGIPGNQPEIHVLKLAPAGSRKWCRRRPSVQTAGQYVETPCTCEANFCYNSNEAGASNRSLASTKCGSKSSSDTEDDTAAHSCRHPTRSAKPNPGRRPPDADAVARDVTKPSTDNEVDRLALSPNTSSDPVPDLPHGCRSSFSANAAGAIEYDDSSESIVLYEIGTVKFTLIYFPINKRLRVIIGRLEDLTVPQNIAVNGRDPNCLFVRVYLVPGKVQRQETRLLRLADSIAVNQEFFFDNVSPKVVEEKSLRIRLYYHFDRKLWNNQIIGTSDVELSSVIGLLSGRLIKYIKHLEPKGASKHLGRITLTCRVEKEARRLTINVLKVDDLPRCGISGPPDVTVRISVKQGQKTDTKQTRTIRRCINPVFKEAVMFLVVTHPVVLDSTTVTITVIDVTKGTENCKTIGHVLLGPAATEQSAIDQWKNTLACLGKDFKATHEIRMQCTAATPENI